MTNGNAPDFFDFLSSLQTSYTRDADWECITCTLSDDLDGRPENSQLVKACTNGHLSHRQCLLRWIFSEGQINIDRCPKCRNVMCGMSRLDEYLDREIIEGLLNDLHVDFMPDVDEFLMWNIQRMHEIAVREEQEELERVDRATDSELTLEQEQEPENQTKEEPSEAELRRAVEGADYSPEESAENLRCMEELRQELMSPNIDADLQCFNPNRDRAWSTEVAIGPAQRPVSAPSLLAPNQGPRNPENLPFADLPPAGIMYARAYTNAFAPIAPTTSVNNPQFTMGGIPGRREPLGYGNQIMQQRLGLEYNAQLNRSQLAREAQRGAALATIHERATMQDPSATPALAETPRPPTNAPVLDQALGDRAGGHSQYPQRSNRSDAPEPGFRPDDPTSLEAHPHLGGRPRLYEEASAQSSFNEPEHQFPDLTDTDAPRRDGRTHPQPTVRYAPYGRDETRRTVGSAYYDSQFNGIHISATGGIINFGDFDGLDLPGIVERVLNLREEPSRRHGSTRAPRGSGGRREAMPHDSRDREVDRRSYRRRRQ